MKKNFFKFAILTILVPLLGGVFFIGSVEATSGLTLEVIEEHSPQYGGNNYVSYLKLTNNTGKILRGTALLHIDYKGTCGDSYFDGNGIKAQFSTASSTAANWLDFSDTWSGGTTTVSGFDISKNETRPRLKMTTSPALCPGKYFITLTIQGVTESQTYTATAPITGGFTSQTTTTLTLSTTIPGKIAGASTEKPFWQKIFPFKKKGSLTTTTTTTTLRGPLPPFTPVAPKYHFNPFLASMLNIGAHIPVWLLVLIAILSFGGAGYLYWKGKQSRYIFHK